MELGNIDCKVSLLNHTYTLTSIPMSTGFSDFQLYMRKYFEKVFGSQMKILFLKTTYLRPVLPSQIPYPKVG